MHDFTETGLPQLLQISSIHLHRPVDLHCQLVGRFFLTPRSSFIFVARSIGQRFVRLVLVEIGDQQALVSMSAAAVATMMNLCCAASSAGVQMLQSAYGFPRTFIRLHSQCHANVNSSRLVAVGRLVPARQLIIHSSISTTSVSLRSCFLADLYHYYNRI